MLLIRTIVLQEARVLVEAVKGKLFLELLIKGSSLMNF